MVDAVGVRRAITAARVIAVRDGVMRQRSDRLAGEEPMEIRAGGPGQEPVSVAVTYTLDGAEVSPRDVVGRSGRLEVTYTVTNLTAEPRDLVAFDAQNRRTTETADNAVPIE
jgi:putative membrane protein